MSKFALFKNAKKQSLVYYPCAKNANTSAKLFFAKHTNNENNFIPGLPLGIIKLLESTKEDLKNKESLIISKSDVFYKPLKKGKQA